MAKHCWSRKDKGATKGKEEGENLARQGSDDSEYLVFMAAVADEDVDSKVWFLDESKKRKIKLANNSSLQAEGIGDVVIHRSNGGKTMIKDVLYVPEMKCNLLSVGQLVEKDFLVVMKNGAL